MHVAELSARFGSDRVPPGVLDEAMDVWRERGMRAARNYILGTRANPPQSG